MNKGVKEVLEPSFTEDLVEQADDDSLDSLENAVFNENFLAHNCNNVRFVYLFLALPSDDDDESRADKTDKTNTFSDYSVISAPNADSTYNNTTLSVRQQHVLAISTSML